MPRKPQVRYYPSRKAFYTQIDGKQYRLGPGPDDGSKGKNYLAAVKVYSELLCQATADTAKDTNPIKTIRDLYLRAIKGVKRPETYRAREKMLARFCEFENGQYGELQVWQLKPTHIDNVIAAHRGRWSNDTIRVFIMSLSAALTWATKKKLISHNPIKGIDKPPGRSRSRECIIDDELHSRILARVRDKSRNVILALWNSGARPGELAAATGKDFDPKLGAIVYFKDDTRLQGEHRVKTGKDRFIFFTGDTLKLVSELAAKNPTGKIFGVQSAETIRKIFTRLKRKLNKPGLTAISYRHTFATRRIEAGQSIEQVAALMGNSPVVLRKHYSHLMSANLRKAADEFAPETLRKAAEQD